MRGVFNESQYLLVIITIIIILLCVGIIFFFWYYHRLLVRLHETIIQKQNETEINTKKEIAFVLHEEVSKNLTFISWNIKKIQNVLANLEQDAEISEALDYCNATNQQLQNATFRIKKLHQTIYPPTLQVLNFCEALQLLIQDFQKSYQGVIVFSCNDNFEKFSTAVKFNLYGLVNLFVTNSIRHSHAGCISVTLNSVDQYAELQLTDNGIGFDIREVEKKATGRGVFDIKSRIIALNPEYFIYESNRQGTILKLTLEFENE